MLALCQHNTLAYYAFYYASIFDAGLVAPNNTTLKQYVTKGLEELLGSDNHKNLV